MKDSALVGAANSGLLKSSSTTPDGSTKAPKGRTGSGAGKEVVFSNTDRAPSTNKDFKIGLNTGSK